MIARGGFISIIEANDAFSGGRDGQFSNGRETSGQLVEGLQVYIDGSGKSGACDIGNMDLLVSILKGEADRVKQFSLEIDEDSYYSYGEGEPKE